MKEIVFLTTKAAENGFGLTGVRHLVTDALEVESVLQGVLADTDVGVIAIEEPLSDALGEKRLQEMIHRWPGVLVTLPAPGRAVSGEADSLQRMVRRALGYHVRLET